MKAPSAKFMLKFAGHVKARSKLVKKLNKTLKKNLKRYYATKTRSSRL